MDEYHYDRGSTTWNYDSRGHVTTELKTIGTQSFTTHWGYNSADQVTTTTYPDGEVVTNEFDSRMLLNSVTGTNPYVSSTTYDSAGRIDVQTFGNNTKTDHDYFSWNTQGGRLEVLKSGTTDNPVSLQNITYSYGPRGNILQMTDALANETNSFGYDALSRLISWSLNGTTETYEYNATTGNLETKAGISLQYNDAAHPHAVTDAGGNSYTYGPNGNQATRIIGGQTYTLGYDAENRLVSVSGAVTASFVYDGDGNRVKSTINGVTTTFVGNWYEVTGSQITKYYFAGTQRVAMRKYIIPQPDTLTYLFGDQLGSTSLAVDASSGEVVETRYKPWGEVRYTTPDKTLPTRYTFTGQYSYMPDEATDLGSAGFRLMFYNARWYDPYLNHFTQPDSIVPDPNNPQAYDRYSYAQNNPVRYTDPTGHSWEDCGDRSGYRCQIHMNHVNRAKAQWAAEAAAEAEYQARSWWKWFFMKFDYKHTACEATLLECYYSSPMQFMNFTEGQQIDSEQFNQLLIAVYFDLKSMDQGYPLQPKDWVRGYFDTPFFGGQVLYRDELTQSYKSWSDTTNVCVEGKCSNRNDINYFAQGMWGAASGQTLEEVYGTSEDWKHAKSSALSVDAKYWIEYGYNKYLELENSNIFETLTHP